MVATKYMRWGRIAALELAGILSITVVGVLVSSIQGKDYKTAELVASVVQLSVKYKPIEAAAIALSVISVTTFLLCNSCIMFLEGFRRSSGHIGLRLKDRKKFALGSSVLVVAWIGILIAITFIMCTGKADVVVNGIPQNLLNEALNFFQISRAFKDQPALVHAVIIGWVAFATLLVALMMVLVESHLDAKRSASADWVELATPDMRSKV